MIRLAALLALLALGGCADRPPGRDPCYLRAEAAAAKRGLDECDGYASTDECPAWPGIEADLAAAQEACP